MPKNAIFSHNERLPVFRIDNESPLRTERMQIIYPVPDLRHSVGRGENLDNAKRTDRWIRKIRIGMITMRGHGVGPDELQVQLGAWHDPMCLVEAQQRCGEKGLENRMRSARPSLWLQHAVHVLAVRFVIGAEVLLLGNERKLRRSREVCIVVRSLRPESKAFCRSGGNSANFRELGEGNAMAQRAFSARFAGELGDEEIFREHVSGGHNRALRIDNSG